VDGDTDFLYVACKEAKEETGINEVIPLSKSKVAIDILPVYGHMKKDKFISAHLHLSVAYILIASEEETLIVNKNENSGVSWFAVDKFTEEYFDIHDVYLYGKLIQRAKLLAGSGARLNFLFSFPCLDGWT
jgi:8-oxo-dGTP pyrophosphatase MutT (NUDIX family)